MSENNNQNNKDTTSNENQTKDSQNESELTQNQSTNENNKNITNINENPNEPNIQNPSNTNEEAISVKLERLGFDIYNAWFKDLDMVNSLIECHNFLESILQCKSIEEIESKIFENNKENFNLFLNKFSKDVITNILRQNIVYGINGEDIAFEILKDYIKILNKFILTSNDENSFKLTPLISYYTEIFDLRKNFYGISQNQKEKDPNSKKLMSADEFNCLHLIKKNSANLININELKIDDYLDIQIKGKERFNNKIWVSGKIKEINSNEKKIICVFEGEEYSFSFNSFEYSKYKSKTLELEWKENLKEGEIVDCYERRKFYPGTIMKRIIEQKGELKYNIAFRVYLNKLDELGENLEDYKKFWPEEKIQKDEKGNDYLGNGDNYSEIIPFYSQRLFKKGTRLTTEIVENFEEEQCENDIDDIICEKDVNGNEVITVARNLYYAYYFNSMLNFFGSIHGFDNMLNYINNSNININNNNNNTILTKEQQTIRNEIISLIFKIFTNYKNFFYKPLYKNFSSKLINYIKNLSNNELRYLTKETTIQLNEILKYSNEMNPEKNSEIETEFSMKLLKTDFLDKRTSSIIYITDLIKSKKGKNEDLKKLIKILKDNKIIEEIYGEKSHIQLVSKSKEIVELLIINNELDENELNLIMNATNVGDLDQKNCIIKIFLEIVNDKNNDNKINEKIIESLLNYFNLEKENKNLNNEIIDLYFNLISKISNEEKCFDCLKNSLKFLKKFNDNSMKLIIIEYLFKFLKKKPEFKKQIILDSLNYIESENEEIGFLILKKFFFDNDLNDESEIKNILIENNKLVNIFKESFKKLYEKNIEKNKENEFKIKVQNHIEFLIFLIEKNLWTKNEEYLDLLYNNLILKKKLENDFEENFFYSFIDELITKKNNINDNNFEINEQKLFEYFDINSDKKIKNFSIKSFEIFIKIFLYVNLHNNLIEKNGENFEIKNKNKTNDLHGIEILKQIIFNNEIVLKNGIEFLNKIYNNDDLLNLCLNQIKNNLKDKNKILKTFSILNILLKENEKFATNEIKSHLNLIKGNKITFKLQLNLGYFIKLKNVSLEIDNNQNLLTLKKLISKQIDFHYDFINFEYEIEDNNKKKSFVEIPQNENGLLLNQIFPQKTSVNLRLSINNLSNSIPQINLTENNQIIPDLLKIFNEWFDSYSINNQMTPQTCAAFVKDVTNSYENISFEDERVKSLFKSKDTNNDGFIEREDFVQFYVESTITKPKLVYENLHAMNYRNDLKTFKEPFYLNCSDEHKMYRYLLGNNDDFIESLFNQVLMLNDNEDDNNKIFDFILNLSTNNKIKNNVDNINFDEDVVDFNKIFETKNLYKFTYQIIFIIYFIENYSNNNNENNNNNSKWILNFIKKDGYKFLIENIKENFNMYNENKENNNNIRLKLLKFEIEIIKLIYFMSIDNNSNKNDFYNDIQKENLQNKISIEFNNIELLKAFLDLLENKFNFDINNKNNNDKNLIISEIIQLIIIIFPNLEINEEITNKIFSIISKSLNNENESIKNNLKLSLIKVIQILINKNEIFLQKLFVDLEKEHTNEINIFIENNNNEKNIFNEIKYEIFFEIFLVLFKNYKENNNFDIKSIINNYILKSIEIITLTLDSINKEESSKYFINIIKEIENLTKILNELNDDDLNNKYSNINNFNNCNFIENLIYFITDNSQNEKNKKLEELIDLKPYKIYSDYINNILNDEQFFFNDLEKIKDNNNFIIDENKAKIIRENLLFYYLINYQKKFNFDIFFKQYGKNLFSQHFIKKYKIETDDNKLNNETFNEYLIKYLNENDLSLINEIKYLQFFTSFYILFKPTLIKLNIINEKEEIVYKNIFDNPNYKINKNDTSIFINIDEETKKFTHDNKSENAINKSQIKIKLYDLILILIKTNINNLEKFFEIFDSIKNQKSTFNNNNINSNSNTIIKKKKFAHVGLKNLGCICYMNSTMQQFFMIPSLRYNILRTNDNEKENLIYTQYLKSNYQIDDNFFHQLQKLFSNLLLSNKQYYNPFEFTFSFKDYEGNPTKIYEQKDAQEFLAIFLDRIENVGLNNEFKYMINNIFGGRNCSLIECLTCHKIKMNFEPILFLSLEVKNMKTLKDSLEKYFNKEFIDGYECDGCKNKVKIEKRNILADLPNVLIVHLQRIFFNWEMNHNEKINSKLEFPKRLNLKDFTIENVLINSSKEKNKENESEKEEINEELNIKKGIYFKCDEYYDYYLKGIVVHVGSADSGHYYSYINTNRDGKGNISNFLNETDEEENWLEFNDSSISKFDIKNMENECFGGIYEDNSNNYSSINSDNFYYANNNSNFANNEKNKNAYMLIYERKIKSPMKILIKNEINNENFIKINENNENIIKFDNDLMTKFNKSNLDLYNKECENLYKKIFYNENKNEYFKFIPFYSFSENRLMPKKYFYEIIKENSEFEINNDYNNSNFKHFENQTFIFYNENILKNINEIIKENNSDKIKKIIDKNFKWIFNKINNNNNEIKADEFFEEIKKIIENLNKIIIIGKEILFEIVFDKFNELFDIFIEMIFNSNEKIVNLSFIFLKLIIIEPFYSNENNNNNNNFNIKYFSNIVLKLIEFFPKISNKLLTNVDYFFEFFKYLYNGNFNVDIKKCFVISNFISRMVTLFIHFQSPSYSEYFDHQSRNKMEFNNRPYNFKKSEIILELMIQIYIDYNNNNFPENNNIIPDNNKITLSKSDFDCITNKTFIAHYIFKNFNIFKHYLFIFSKNNNEITINSSKHILYSIDFDLYKFKTDYFLELLKLIFNYLKINDDLVELRTNLLLNKEDPNTIVNKLFMFSKKDSCDPEPYLICLEGIINNEKIYDYLKNISIKEIYNFINKNCVCNGDFDFITFSIHVIRKLIKDDQNKNIRLENILKEFPFNKDKYTFTEIIINFNDNNNNINEINNINANYNSYYNNNNNVNNIEMNNLNGLNNNNNNNIENSSHINQLNNESEKKYEKYF